jgi:hypothetical protein
MARRSLRARTEAVGGLSGPSEETQRSDGGDSAVQGRRLGGPMEGAQRIIR